MHLLMKRLGQRGTILTGLFTQQMWQGGLGSLCLIVGVHWQVSSTSCRKSFWPTFTSCLFSSHITSSILPIVFTPSFWLFLAFSWLPPRITFCSLLVCVLLPGFGMSSIHFTYLCSFHPASCLARFSILIPSGLFLRELYYFTSNQPPSSMPHCYPSSFIIHTLREQCVPYMLFKFCIMPIFLVGQY